MKKKLKRVEGTDNLYRTPNGAIINTDDGAYNAYVRKKNSSKKKTEEIQCLSKALNEAKEEIKELKEMLRKVLETK